MCMIRLSLAQLCVLYFCGCRYPSHHAYTGKVHSVHACVGSLLSIQHAITHTTGYVNFIYVTCVSALH